MSKGILFQVPVILYSTSSIVNQLIESEEHHSFLEALDTVFDTDENIKLCLTQASSEDEVRRAVSVITSSHSAKRIIIISDQLCEKSGSGTEFVPTNFCREIRAKFFHAPQQLCGLVSLITGPSQRISDIDRVISLQDLNLSQLKGGLLQVAKNLWLKSPRPSTFDKKIAPNFHIRIVQNIEELKECLKLRHFIYNALGYLETPVSQCKSQIEIDMFDTQSIHLVALENKSNLVIGTIRVAMVSPNGLLRSIIGDPSSVLSKQGKWIEMIAHEAVCAGDVIFSSSRLHCGMGIPLPILRNSDFGNKFKDFLFKYSPDSGGEISRLVVSPKYRGLGVSNQLMRASIAIAVDILKSYLLLECIPIHIPMYEKYGFKRIEGHHCRAQEIDQVAVGMVLDFIEDYPYSNPHLARARSDRDILTNNVSDCASSHSHS